MKNQEKEKTSVIFACTVHMLNVHVTFLTADIGADIDIKGEIFLQGIIHEGGNVSVHEVQKLESTIWDTDKKKHTGVVCTKTVNMTVETIILAGVKKCSLDEYRTGMYRITSQQTST